jgi:hypothetical protein
MELRITDICNEFDLEIHHNIFGECMMYLLDDSTGSFVS